MAKSRFMMGYMMYCKTELPENEKPKEDTNLFTDITSGITKGITDLTKTTTNILQMGVNFVIPLNIFWDKVFCIMATSKSYVL